MRISSTGRCLFVLAACGITWGQTANSGADDSIPPKSATRIEFDRDVRPILSDKCFACHGPDASNRKADLRLDRQESAIESKAIVPGKIDESELVRRVASRDPEEIMPPPKHGKPLKPSEIATLTDWVRQGGGYTRHWSFTPPRKPSVPKLDGASSDHPIDRFILAKLRAAGLEPSPTADRITLIRRLSLDLVGLPPTPAEVDAFVNDRSEQAYERLVDRLLRSPHHGERWARLWLDAARYADSDGYEKDKSRQVWFYRDWVIRAFNRDMPYDRFILEQIAGDLLPNADQDQIVATGFLRNSMINEEGGVDPEQFRMEAMFDRMDAVGKSILGLTIQCGQCHSHKYDPMTQEEYYRMFAFLNNSDESNIEVFTPEQLMARSNALRRAAELETELKHASSDWEQRLEKWRRSVSRNQPKWIAGRPSADDISTGGQKYFLLPDDSILAQGYAPTKHTVKMTAESKLPKITALRLEMLNDPNLPNGGPGRSVRGTWALSEIEVLAAPLDNPTKTTRVKIARAQADLNPPESPLDTQFKDKSDKKRVVGPIAFAIDGKDDTAWSNEGSGYARNQPCKAVFTFETPVSHPKGTILTINLKQNHGGWNSDDNQNCNLGRFRLSVCDVDNPPLDPLPPRVRLLVDRDGPLSPNEQRELFSHWRTTVPEWTETNKRIAELLDNLPRGTTQLVLHEKAENPRPTKLLQRGDFLKPVSAVRAGVPAFLNPLPADAPPNRLGFAMWLTSREAPTTARSIVNRVWQAYFGTGIVATSEDLGSQGEPPSHPELLDWLSADLMENGWSLKRLHKTIVMSRAYRQSSRVTPEHLAKDPFNRLLSRGPRIRVDAEIVRDIALAASGLLDEKVGGPSVQPPAPAFLFVPPASYGPKVWSEAKGSDRYRRGLYTFRFRSVPYPALQTFDAPNGDFSCVKRSRSNTPLQALTTLNEPLFVECARALGKLILDQGGASDADKLAFAFRRCVSRVPSERESKVLLALLDKETDRFSGPDAKPWEVAAEDPAHPPKLPAGVSPARLAAWTVVARVLLNLDETITKE